MNANTLPPMNGAESLVRTLVANGVEVCFTNPGTSEMHFVAALDRVDGMRCVLGLFEGVVTGAADGYYRMADKPASHAAASRARLSATDSPTCTTRRRRGRAIVNIVGEHAPLPHRTRRAAHGRHRGHRARRCRTGCAPRAVVERHRRATVRGRRRSRARRAGQIATLILPADTAWSEGGEPWSRQRAERRAATVAEDAIRSRCRARAASAARRAAARRLACASQRSTGRPHRREDRLPPAVANMHSARIERGAGRVADRARAIQRRPGAHAARRTCADVVLAGAKPPVAFFAYPDKPCMLTPPDCDVHDARRRAPTTSPARSKRSPMRLDARTTRAGARRAGCAPGAADGPAHARRHRAGDSAHAAGERDRRRRSRSPPGRGFGVPTANARAARLAAASSAARSASACPPRRAQRSARPVARCSCLEGDGSAMYTLQSLWTMAREGLDVNDADLRQPLVPDPARRAATRRRRQAGPQGANDMLTLDRPHLDWVALARGHGVDAGRVEDLDQLRVRCAPRSARRGLT